MGEARFAAEKTVDVTLNDGGTRRLTGDRVFLDLGTHATVPEVPGLAGAQPMTHVELLDLDRLPEHLVVLGGGYVGLELAQAMRRFGSGVTVIELREQLAPQEDPDVSAAVLDLFRDEGIDATDLLVAVGRTPSTGTLGLDQTGVQRDEHGCIRVDEHLATTAPGVWAMGECAGSPQFTHVAFDDFRVVYDALTCGPSTTRDRLIPYCVFTDPELARVGRNESQARRDGLGYRLLSLPMAAVQTAMIAGLPYTGLRNGIFAHPTMAEGLTFLVRGAPSAPGS